MNEDLGKKIIRAPSLKRGKIEEKLSNRIRLEKVLGVTVANNAALSSDNNGIVAYPAGCTVVFFNTKTEQQSHIINVSKKTISSLAFSSCGRYLVTGECGHQPAVRVWDLQSDPQSQHPGLPPQPQQIAEFLGHKYGVNCVAFSPNAKYVVSVGTQHDMIVNVWDWKNNIKIASNKVSTKVKSIAFAENGSYFVTVGNRHVKFWYLEQGKAKNREAVPLMGRSAILGEQRNNYFCDVACGKADSGDSTYAITRSGLLCEFNNRRLLDKWVELRTQSANCITVGEKYIFVGCAEGIIRCFDPELRFVTTLPRSHYLGVDVALGTSIQHMATPPLDAKYPDTIAISYDEVNNKLTSIYNDHSIYVWDVFNIKRVGKSFSFLYHSACIWGVEMAPSDGTLPPGSFLTCSSDDTIRFWSLDKPDKTSRGIFPPNIYSKELMKVVYIDKDLAYLKDLDISTTQTNEKTSQESSAYDGRNGVRCIRISPDGKNLASGDRSGNIRIHDIATMKELFKIEAHDAEVLCLEYSQNDPNHNLLASASRDRLIHVFDVKHGYNFIQTLDDHSSSITAVRFLKNSRNLQMVSCGADKSLIFRSISEQGTNKNVQFVRDHNATGKTTLYDMEVDTGQKHVLTACQDRNVRIYSVNNGKHTKSFKGSAGDEGTLIKVVLDRSGIYLATSCTDKSLSVYDYYSGECMATMCGHSELATGLKFTNDCRRLISASGDGCIFVWRVPHDMVITMHARLSQQAMRQGKPLDNRILEDELVGNPNENPNYRFSIGQLPQWAKKQLTDDSGQLPNLNNKGVAAPKGRWAQRAETNKAAKSLYSISPFASLDVRHDGSDGSKDSSLDSGTDTKHHLEFKKEVSSHIKMTQIGETRRGILTDDSAIGDADLTAHDGDIDSDHEYRHRPLYYPTQADSASGSEFTVSKTDQEELRKSQRKKKPPQILLTQTTPTIYGSNESDDDEDDASTPSGENTDRNPMSLLSLSSESLDHLVNREKYLQSTFESMSGAENEMTPTNKMSISSKFLRTGDRNQEAINAVVQAKSDPEVMRKREELNKRIAETKKKLESVGHSNLKYSQSIHDLSHIPVRDNWNKKKGNDCDFAATNTNNVQHYPTTNTNCSSVPNDLQLCGCFMQDIQKNLLNYNELIRPRKLKLDKTLTKFKLNKSLPVSPVSEERQFSDFVNRKSFSYFVDLEEVNTDQSFREVCADIEKFSQDFNRKYEDFDCQYEDSKVRVNVEEEDGNFSSDSLEDYSFRSVKAKGVKKQGAPRRCVSNNEIYKLQEFEFVDIPKSESFYLNQNIRNSQDSILSDEQLDLDKSYCNSMESVLSNESDCKSAPLEVLFKDSKMLHSKSLPIDCPLSQSVPKEFSYIYNYDYFNLQPKVGDDFKRSRSMYDSSTSTKTTILKTSQTQTDFVTPEEIVAKKKNASEDFQKKLLKFETTIAQTNQSKQYKENVPLIKKDNTDMYIPSLASKNKQYKSKFCNVLNNKPEFNIEIYESGNSKNLGQSFTVNFDNRSKNKETSSLDRHLFAKSLFTSEKVTHKPPKSVRRHSSKTRKPKTSYEYVKKEDYCAAKNNLLNNQFEEKTIEFCYKEKNLECDLEMSNRQQATILNELYDSLDKNIFSSKNDLDSLEMNLNTSDETEKLYDSLESNLWHKNHQKPKHLDFENLKILTEIQRKIQKINQLIDIFKKNVTYGKVRTLSSLYESLHNFSYYNDLTKLQTTPIKFRRRNLSLPSFVERRLNFEPVNVEDSNDSSLRRSCSLVDLSMNSSSVRKLDNVSGKKNPTPATRSNSRYQKNNSISRSRSTTVLNASDSDNENHDKNKISRLMRPTISSHNKANNTNKGLGMNRKKQSYSTSNLSTVGVENVSTSDDDLESKKPTVPPRNRSGNYEGGLPIITPRKHLNNKEKNKALRHTIHFDDKTLTNEDFNLSNESGDSSSVEIEDTIDKLTKAAENVVKLYNNLVNDGDENTESHGQIDRVKMSIIRTHKILHDCILSDLKQTNSNIDVNQTDTVKKLNDLVSKGPTGPNSVVNIMEQYSDILLDMVQQKIHNANI